MKNKKGQLSLWYERRECYSFGGSMLVGKRKSRRPLSTKLPIHLVLRASRAHRVLRYRHQANSRVLQTIAKKFHVHIFEHVFNHTHAHIVLRVPSREAYNAFIRLLTARLATLATQIDQRLTSQKLFTLRPFTRVLPGWGRALFALQKYMKKNFVEAIGSIEVTRDELLLHEAYDGVVLDRVVFRKK